MTPMDADRSKARSQPRSLG